MDRLVRRRDAQLQRLTDEMEGKEQSHQEIETIISRGKQEWEATFDSVQDMIVITDLNGIILRCNRTTSDTFLTGFRQLIGRQIDELFLGKANGEQKRLPSMKTEMKVSRLEGWYEISSTPLSIDSGRQGKIYIIRNITDRKQAITDLQSQMQYYESLVRNSPVAIVTLNLEQRLIDCNPAFENLFGYSKQEVLSQDLESLISPYLLIEETRAISETVRRGEIAHEFTLRRKKDGSSVDVEILASGGLWESKLAFSVSIMIYPISSKEKHRVRDGN
jgi:PAS domain S-box-containing protein